MEDKILFSNLLDYYSGLLPEKQRECMIQYYYDDLSLAEISENQGITRQGVYDLIKRGEASLKKAERELKLIKKRNETRKSIKELIKVAAWVAKKTNDEEAAEECRDIVKKLLKELETY